MNSNLSISPVPTEEEAAAIVAAVMAATQSNGMVASPLRQRSSAWKFSGRWWAKPSTARRDRPWF